MAPRFRGTARVAVGIAASLLAVGARSKGAAADRIWLPHVVAPSSPGGCAPASPGPWEVRCGGFGRIRDLYALSNGAALAVGDGAARFSGSSWAAQLGGGLHGLEALTVAEGPAGPDSVRGWAVGEADLIAQMDQGQWRPDAPGERDHAVSLSAVSAEGQTWAAGSRGNGAALRWLRFDAGEEGRWHDVPDQADQLPPIADMITIVDGSGRPAGWAVGSTGVAGSGRGAFVRYDGRWTIAQEVVGEPEELVLTSLDSGWAFGSFPTEAGASLAFWRLAPQSVGQWIEEPALRLPGRRLIDTYQRAPDGPDRVVVSLEPTGGLDPVVYTYRPDDDLWGPVARPPPAVAETVDREAARSGSGAIAPLADDTVLYAWGDDVWSIDLESDVWTPVRERRRLGPLAAAWSSALALGRDREGFLLSTSTWTAQWPPAGPPDGAWEFMDGSATAAWALARDGTTLTVRGPLGRWHVGSPPVRPQDVTAIRADGNAVLAAGRADDTLAMWRGDGDTWRRLQFQGGAAPVTANLATMEAAALAAWPHGWIWAATRARDTEPTSAALGAIVALPPACRGADCAARTHTFGVPLTAVAATGPDQAWAAGGHVLVHCNARDCRQQSPSPAPFGARFVALAAGAPNDVWAVLQDGDPERASSLVLHFDGARWVPTCRTDVALSGAAVVHGQGGRVLWLTGDWTTVIRHEYRGSPDAERPCGPS